MDGGNVLVELESAAQMLMGPPNLVAQEQRQQAEQIFLNFRKTKSPYHMCKQLLEQSKNNYVLFEASGLLKEGLIREWHELSAQDISQLRSYLLQYVVNNPLLSAYVRERIVQVIAIMVKRRSVEDGGEDRGVVIGEVQQLITGGNAQMQLIGCSIITALMQEYATTVKSSDVGLPWEVHFKAKKQFESTDLQNIFKFSVGALRELAANLVLPLNEEMRNLVRRLTVISETVLSWTFINVNLPKKLISVFEADQNPSLRPGAAWKEVMLEPTLVSFFFDLHWRVRADDIISHHTLNCLVQLASLNGQTMNTKELRLQYLSNYISGFSNLVTNITASGNVAAKEALGLSAMIRKLILFYPPSILVMVQQELLQKYLEQVVTLTCGFMRAGVSSGASDLSDELDLFTEATEHVLEAWVCILHENTIFPQGYCKEAAAAILKTYIEVNLASPEGSRARQVNEEIEETEESDRVRYKDTLSVIGALGRECLDQSLPILISLLEGRIGRLHGQIQRIASQGCREIDAVLGDLFEDVHWVVLIAGNVLSLDVDGETALIPSEVMQHSIHQAGSIDVSKSLEVLASPGKPASDIPGHESSDHVLRLVGAVFRLSEIEKRCVEAGLVSLWSPEIGSTIMWFLRRWSLTYLATQEGYYQEMSIALCTAFGRDTDGAAWTVNFLLEKILSNLTQLNSEPTVVEDTIRLLVSLADCKEKCQAVLKSPGLIRLVELATRQERLPAKAKRGLLKALVLVGAAQENAETRDSYWAQVLKPLETRYQAVVGRDNIKMIYMEDSVRNEVIDIMESFTGVVQGCHVTTVHQVFAWFKPSLASLVHLLALYHHYSVIVELVLELYCETAKRILCYFTAAESKFFYENSLALIRTYAQQQVGKRTVDKEAEEEQYRDLLLLMELLTNLLSKDFIDLSPPESGADTGENVTAADVCLFGLNIIMPLMSAELLKFPNLCLQYFKTITFVCEIYPEKITTLDLTLQKNLVASLELGLTNIGVDTVYTLCCDFIQVLGCYMVRHKLQATPIYEPLRPFLKLLLDLILSQNINSELIPHSSATLYVLICLFQDTYHQLVDTLLQAQADPTNRQRLMEAFTALMHNIPMGAERIHRIRFRDNFDKFIVNKRGGDITMTGNFQPAKLDVDSSILDSGLKIVDDPEDQISQLFPSSQRKNNPINTLLSAGEADYQTATVVPKPGICVKTKNAAGTKFFINLCKLAEIPAPPPIEESELSRLIESEDYNNLWRVPMSLGAPRRETDKSGGECWAAEVAVNSAWFDKTMASSDLFTGFVLTIAMEGLCDKYGEDARLDRDKWTVLKNKKFIGDLAKCPAHRVQIRQNLITETLEKHSPGSSQIIKPSAHSSAKKSMIIEEITANDKDREPNYKIFREPGNRLRCEVKLPGINSVKDILLDVGEDRIVVTAVKTKHLLDVFLPVNMDSNKASANFVIDDHTLSLSVPIVS